MGQDSSFQGFPLGHKKVSVPALFFGDFLTEIDSLVALKVALRSFWYVDKSDSDCLNLDDLYSDKTVANIVGLRGDSLKKEVESIFKSLIDLKIFQKCDCREGSFKVNLVANHSSATKISEISSKEPVPAVFKLFGSDVSKAYEKYICPITPAVGDRLESILTWTNEDTLIEAIKLADLKQQRSIFAVEKLTKRLSEVKTD